MIPFDVLSYWSTGSRYICDPPPMDTDNDTVILVEDLQKVYEILLKEEWKPGGSYHENDKWISFKKEINGVLENYIVTQDTELYGKWVTATELCKKLNLLRKEDRIITFKVVVEGATLY